MTDHPVATWQGLTKAEVKSIATNTSLWEFAHKVQDIQEKWTSGTGPSTLTISTVKYEQGAMVWRLNDKRINPNLPQSYPVNDFFKVVVRQPDGTEAGADVFLASFPFSLVADPTGEYRLILVDKQTMEATLLGAVTVRYP